MRLSSSQWLARAAPRQATSRKGGLSARYPVLLLLVSLHLRPNAALNICATRQDVGECQALPDCVWSSSNGTCLNQTAHPDVAATKYFLPLSLQALVEDEPDLALSPDGRYLNCTFVESENEIGETACQRAAGNVRVQCYSNADSLPAFSAAAEDDRERNSWGVCACDTFYGWKMKGSENCELKDVDLDRFRPECLLDVDSCSEYSWVTHLNAFWGLVNSIFALFIIIRAIRLIYQIALSRTGFHLNAVGSTLILSLSATIFVLLWDITYPICSWAMTPWWAKNVMNTVGIPCTAITYVGASLNVSMMWIAVVQSSKTMKKQGANLGGKAKSFVLGMAGTFGVGIFVFFVILQSTFLGAAFSIFYILMLLVIFQIASRKLTALFADGTSQTSSKMQHIIDTANALSLWYGLYFLASLGYSLYGMIGYRKTKMGIAALEPILIFILCQTVLHGLRVLLSYVAYNTRKLRGVVVGQRPNGVNSTVVSEGDSEGDA